MPTAPAYVPDQATQAVTQLPVAAPSNTPAPAAPRPTAPAPAQASQASSQQVPLAAPASPSQAPATSGAPTPTVRAPAQPVDRIQLAQDAWASFAKASDPYYQKSLRDATSTAAGAGQLGSGQLRTSLGDLSQQRNLELDTARDNLIRQATEGSIADASTAYQQQLATAQQGLAERIGTGQLGLGQGQLDLAREGQQGSQALQQRALELDELVRTGQMTLAERDQALREMQSGQQMDLARAGVTGQIQTGLDEDGNPVYGETQAARDSRESRALQERALELDELVRTGQMTLAERDQALRELSQRQSNELQVASLAQGADQFTRSLAQNAAQFGLSQAQQLQIAQLTDRTQNRQLDLNSELGRQNLLVQLANILGGPTGTGNPAFLQAVARALGIGLGGGSTTTTGTTGTGVTGGTSTGTSTSGSTGEME